MRNPAQEKERDITGRISNHDRNEVNQYESILTALAPIPGVQELHYDPDGNLSEALTLGDVDGDGDVDQGDLDAMLFAFETCEGDPDYNPRANFDPTNLCGDDPNLQTIGQDDLDVVLFYFGLPSTGSIRATMTWDAENRLASWQALVPTTGSKKLKFKYDYMGRRVEKAVYVWDPNLGDGGDWPGSPTSVRRYVWRDWLRLMELDGSGNVRRRWTWGRDLSGTLEGAGGIGGLLSVHDANETPGDPNDDFKYVYFYDANGNVGQVVDLAVSDPNNTIKAKYEYDAYGNVTSSGGAYAIANVIRFSTKPWDDETGMGDWGGGITTRASDDG